MLNEQHVASSSVTSFCKTDIEVCCSKCNACSVDEYEFLCCSVLLNNFEIVRESSGVCYNHERCL